MSFATKGSSDGSWMAMIEEAAPGLPVLKRSDPYLMLHFRDEINQVTAQRFVAEIRRMIDGLSHTTFIT